jgi:hypothetical protein
MVESLMSGLKRTTDSALSARGGYALFIKANLRVLAYALPRLPDSTTSITSQQSKPLSKP